MDIVRRTSRSKKSGIKGYLFILVLFIATSYSSYYAFTILNSAQDNAKDSSESKNSFEIENILQNDLNLNMISGVTLSEIPDEAAIAYTSCFVGFLLITDVAVIVRKQQKIAKSNEVKPKTTHDLIEKCSSQEHIILNIIQDYLSKNRFLDIGKIVPYINSRLAKSDSKLNKNGIEAILTKLLKKNIIVDGSKYTRENLLVNSNRNQIYNYILDNPGIHFMNIVNFLGMSIFLVKWHLTMLLRFNLIKTDKVENREIYFDSRIPNEKAKALHFLARERTIRIIDYLKTNPKGCPKYRISKELHIHPNTMTKYLLKLEELNYVSKEKMSNKTLFFLNNISLC